MIEPDFTQLLSMLISNAALLASVLAILIASAVYALCIISAHRTNAQFSLGRLEEFELERAILLYQKALDRLQHILHEGQQIQAGLLARYRYRKQIGRKFAAELHDLRSYQAHLRSMIVRLRSGPVQRFKSWLHLDSACFALSRSLTLCLLVLGMLGVCSYLADQPDLLGQRVFEGETITAALATWFAWPPADGRMLDTSSLGGVLLAVATPILYSYRRAKLHLMHRQQFRALKKFAAADPDRLIHQAPPLAAGMPEDPLESAPDIPDERSWFSILGVARSASTDEIKQAYKARVKQNHPDRVGEMSPLFRELAEAETKKINAAYEQAMSLQRA
ncbi:MAG: J domain-containing protein [Alphaproteobacteria bacterium]|nr:MAG: J domain-containing protein [Alphaproteobacteria bacterium]